MLKYYILIAVVIIVFPILSYIVRQRNIGKRLILGALAGLFIAIIGLVMQGSFNPLYVLLVMFGLAFAVSILLNKRSIQNGADNVPVTLETYQDTVIEETASSVEANLFTDKPNEDEVNYNRKERPDGE
ncbi:hypothetical protein [Sporosarcina sp. FSL K6-1508]|uniref:hypothetical protein n=1 Tax=Sporosarcina sp. FSL K6-1508 TaxID=2921553 RepID=UPI0030FA2534